jgi:hypothetical protein
MIKPIETRYKGYRFRSRLEARWAVFFDCMGSSWEYEPEGFVLDDGTHYLPDFRVKTPQGKDIWYEIKRADVFEDPKFNAFIKSVPDSDHSFRAALLSGDPVEHLSRKTVTKNKHVSENKICPRCGLIDDPAYGYDFSTTWGNDSFGCEPCDFETPSGGDNDDEIGILNATVIPHKGLLLLEGCEYNRTIAPRIVKAAEAARSARFEHGELHA